MSHSYFSFAQLPAGPREMRTAQLLLFVFLVILRKETKSSGLPPPVEESQSEVQELEDRSHDSNSSDSLDRDMALLDMASSPDNKAGDWTTDSDSEPEFLPSEDISLVIQDVLMSHENILDSEKTQSRDTLEEDGGSGAEDKACIDDPCGEREQCRNLPEGGFTCDCQDGWRGPNCNVSSCGQPCQHGGVCQLNEDGNYSCVDCEDGWTGPKCDVSSCGEPCQNGGVCKLNEDGEYACDCSAGWRGPTCSEDVNECHQQALGIHWYHKQTTLCNQGQCENTMGGYKCTCNPGYGGDDCSTWEGCNSESCKNRGRCFESSTWNGWTYSDSIRCDCPLAFLGDFCEKENHCYSNPCGNGGECTNQDEDFVCDCFPGLTGRHCQDRDFSVCLDSPCGRHGDCREVLGGRGYEVSCTCHHGFDGDRCERDLLIEKEESINRLKTTISSQQSSINRLNTRISNQQLSVNRLNTRISNQQWSINRLNAKISNQQSSINNLEESNNNLKVSLRQKESEVTRCKREVEGFERKQERNKAAVRALFDKLEDSTHRTKFDGLPGACRTTHNVDYADDLTRSFPEPPSFSSSEYFTDPDFGGSEVDDGGSGFDFDYFG